MLDGFQKIGLRHRPLRQAYAQRILMHTHAEDLSELKAYLDDGPDYHTTFKLLYSDFQVTHPARKSPKRHVDAVGVGLTGCLVCSKF